MHKKSGVFLIVFILLLTIIAIPAQADNTIKIEDSKNISEESIAEIMEAADAEPTADIIKIYNVGIAFAFAQYSDIDSILKCDEALDEYYVVISPDDSYSFWSKQEGSIRPLKVLYHSLIAINMCQSEDVVNYISDEITVFNRYCLSGESSHMGFAIYYETNKGDYVHYHHYSVGELLFPVETFCEFQKAVLEEGAKKPYSVGIDFSGVWDLSPYDFKADTFNLHAEIPQGISGDVDPTQGNQRAPHQLGLIFGICVVCILATIPLVLRLHKKRLKLDDPS